ncbi:hypothetical protein ASD8599_04019 [Ascidiaceihabitans donghaensis]|uniref:Uncharacterized protein n=1 Tax=Ascidiaceihabitans donghaensis TaxID=1510460 RepID=A0A2R8BPW4_9RHOB|nr:hypothetical protein ASD8599_04019 [Ascidiaceihabitans donghaensis]
MQNADKDAAAFDRAVPHGQVQRKKGTIPAQSFNIAASVDDALFARFNVVRHKTVVQHRQSLWHQHVDALTHHFDHIILKHPPRSSIDTQDVTALVGHDHRVHCRIHDGV